MNCACPNHLSRSEAAVGSAAGAGRSAPATIMSAAAAMMALASKGCAGLIMATVFLGRRRAGSREYLAEGGDRAHDVCLGEPRPLHPHDEVVDADELVIACDLFLHERFFADDEAIARKVLERLVERFRPARLLVETPGRIGAIFVLESGPALRQRLPPRRADVAFAYDRDLLRKRFAHLAQRLAVELHLPNERAQVCEVGDEPGVADTGSAFDCRIDHAGEPDRRSVLLQRLEPDAEVIDRENLAPVGHAILGPQSAHELDALRDALNPLAQRHVEGIELGFAIAGADAQHIAAARQQIE